MNYLSLLSIITIATATIVYWRFPISLRHNIHIRCSYHSLPIIVLFFVISYSRKRREKNMPHENWEKEEIGWDDNMVDTMIHRTYWSRILEMWNIKNDRCNLPSLSPFFFQCCRRSNKRIEMFSIIKNARQMVHSSSLSLIDRDGFLTPIYTYFN